MGWACTVWPDAQQVGHAACDAPSRRLAYRLGMGSGEGTYTAQEHQGATYGLMSWSSVGGKQQSDTSNGGPRASERRVDEACMAASCGERQRDSDNGVVLSERRSLGAAEVACGMPDISPHSTPTLSQSPFCSLWSSNSHEQSDTRSL